MCTVSLQSLEVNTGKTPYLEKEWFMNHFQVAGLTQASWGACWGPIGHVCVPLGPRSLTRCWSSHYCCCCWDCHCHWTHSSLSPVCFPSLSVCFAPPSSLFPLHLTLGPLTSVYPARCWENWGLGLVREGLDSSWNLPLAQSYAVYLILNS